jgi:symplekin
MDRAAAEDKIRKTAIAESRKRPASASEDGPSDAKRPKLDPDPATNNTGSASFLAGFDFTSLPAPLITELIVANLQAFSESDLMALVQAHRQSRGIGNALASTSSAIPPPQEPAPPISAPVAPSSVKSEPIDPLKMDIDEELEYEPDRINLEVCRYCHLLLPIALTILLYQLSGHELPADPEQGVIGVDENALQLIDFKLPPPRELSEDDRNQLLRNSVSRIWTGGEEVKAGEIPIDPTQTGVSTEIWMILVVRMITRVAEPPPVDGIDADAKKNLEDEGTSESNFYMQQDRLRQVLCDYIMTDFPAR